MIKTKYKFEVPDSDYWRKQIKCQWACPVKTDSRGYVIAISEKRYLDAYKIARGPNPFASICGRVCGAPCEMDCRRGSIDESITIRALKRFATEKYGVEAADPALTIEFSNARRDPQNSKAGTKVAVVGGGVAGMTAAHDLALLGYKVTVFESQSFAGGMLVAGVPVYRLPRDLVQKEIDAILSLGVELKLNTIVGKDITIPELRQQGYKAILLSCGLQKSRKFEIEGSNLEGVLHGIEFLKQANLGKKVQMGEKVIVVGGGNVAYDVARSVVRHDSVVQHAEAEDFYEATNAARMAIRGGAREVHLICLESREEMPADDVEIIEGAEEGVILHTSRGPLRIVGSNGKVAALATRKVKSVFDPDGRFNPSYDEEPGEQIEADTIIFAIGQEADINYLKGEDNLKVSNRGLIEIDAETKRTNIPDIFACGDAATGAKLFIHAIAGGQKAAVSIDEYLRGKELVQEGELKFEMRVGRIIPENCLEIPRINPLALESSKRLKSNENVELNFKESVARDQGSRCLRCNTNTIFNGNLCISCGGCVDVCPTYCLKIVPLSEIEIGKDQEQLIQNRYNINSEEFMEIQGRAALGQVGSVMLKDESRCIRCGFCQKRCPTGAVKLEQLTYRESFSWK